MTARVEELGEVESLVDLASDAEADGHRFVTRMIDEWRDGSNRFAEPRERAYCIRFEGNLVAVGGLNTDPYISDSEVGRVRHLYVAKSQRRSGLGSLLLAQIVDAAQNAFSLLRLRTLNEDAAAFYVARGFSVVMDDEFCTHELKLGA